LLGTLREPRPRCGPPVPPTPRLAS
jgi:hypothetical protein